MSDTTASIIELMANGCPLTYRGLNPRFLFSSNFRSELHYQAWWCLSLRGENDILPLLQFLSYGQGLVFSKLLSVPWFPFLWMACWMFFAHFPTVFFPSTLWILAQAQTIHLPLFCHIWQEKLTACILFYRIVYLKKKPSQSVTSHAICIMPGM